MQNIIHNPALSAGITFARRIILRLASLKRSGTGGTNNARYCYSVWLRHLTLAHKNGLSFPPKVVAELGPGDSIGTGLAALLSGTYHYHALDVVRYANLHRNLNVLEELKTLFQQRSNIPDQTEFPEVKPLLESYGFPKHILADECLEIYLSDERYGAIQDALTSSEDRNSSMITYYVPWHDSRTMMKNSVDMIFSQAVLEHVEDLRFTYEAMWQWLKPGGFMSHQVDFRSHGMSLYWNGHWIYSETMWNLIRHNLSIPINRQPFSAHITLLEKIGFQIRYILKSRNYRSVPAKYIAPQWSDRLSTDDLSCAGAFIIAQKPKT